jgi:hypothetical protein
MASIVSDDALILPHRANPRGWNFRERQASLLYNLMLAREKEVDDLVEQYEEEPSIQLDQEQAIPVREVDTTAHLPPQHNQLTSEHRVLCLKSAL